MCYYGVPSFHHVVSEFSTIKSAILSDDHQHLRTAKPENSPKKLSSQLIKTERNFLYICCRDEDYRKAMNELTSFSFTAKNLHDDAADSMAMLAAYVFDRSKVATVARRPF